MNPKKGADVGQFSTDARMADMVVEGKSFVC